MKAESTATQSQQPMQKLLYDRKTAAWSISVSTRSVDYLIANGELETRRIGRKILITAASLKRYAAANHFGPIAPSEHVRVVA